MMQVLITIFVAVACQVFVVSGNNICQRLPIHTTATRTPGDNGFSIKIRGLPAPGKYMPDEQYTVVIQGAEKTQTLLGFMLVVVPQGTEDEATPFKTDRIGNFSTDLVQQARHCDHTVITHHYLMKKKRVEMDWQAPGPDAGCLEFRATVIGEESDQWYKDEGGLTHTVCPYIVPEIQGDEMGSLAPECCACGEARYRMVFKGLWSKQTHPKDFPTGRDALLLHWSNIVGATHTPDYKVWEYGQYASRGVREVCEYGYSTNLEADMKRNTDKIYTVIKTTPMWRDVLQTREAVFKVNQQAHQVSLLTMIGPSPDWCIGISALSMCNANCTWADDMEVDLYPWDAGTDDGIRYVNTRKTPSDPQERIHEITNTFPRHPDSPFYGPNPVQPLARITLTKIKEVCGSGEDSSDTEDSVPSTADLIDQMKQKMMMAKKLEMMKCATLDWTEWSDCSNNCGTGMRQRSRVLSNPDILPSMCSNVELMEKESCEGDCNENMPRKVGREKLSDNFEVRHTYELNLNDPCVVTPWSDWSPCSAKVCGRGLRERWRMFLRKSAQEMNCGVSIMEKDVCFGIIPDCRKAFMMKNFTAICSLPKNEGPCRGMFQRWYYDTAMRKCLPFRYGGCRGNDNTFETELECSTQCADYMNSLDATVATNTAELTETSEAELQQIMMKKKMMAAGGGGFDPSNRGTQDDIDFTVKQKKRKMQRKARRLAKMKKKGRRKNKKSKKEMTSDGPPVDCMMTAWTPWSECSVTCGKGIITRDRMVKREASGGGRKCPRKLQRRKKCKIPKCPIDCRMSEWTDWSECTATCGPDAVQERRRDILVKPKHNGMDCPSRREKRSCGLPECTDNTEMREFMEKMQADRTHH